MKKTLLLTCIAFFACNFLNANSRNEAFNIVQESVLNMDYQTEENGDPPTISDFLSSMAVDTVELTLCDTANFMIPDFPGCTVYWSVSENLHLIGQFTNAISVVGAGVGLGRITVTINCGGIIQTGYYYVNVSLGFTPTYHNYSTIGSMTINTISTISGTFIVNAYHTVHVTADIYATPDAKIIVRPSGRLIIDGATITSYCSILWEGIIVYGDIDNDPPSHGLVAIVNDGTIENALLAIDAITGGEIDAIKANFINNYTAVQIDRNSEGIFIDTKFDINNNFLGWYGGGTRQPDMVRLNDTHANVLFGHCTFTTSLFRYTGIRAYNTTFIVEECSFVGFRHGIYADNLAGMLPGITVGGSEFSSNGYGILLNAMNEPIITDNRFFDNTIGLDMSGSTRYVIERNIFRNNHNILNTVGIIVSDSGPAENVISSNNFYDLEIGIWALGRNSDQPFPGISGLQFLCNYFEDTTEKDILVGGYGNPADHSVRREQGSLARPAGNVFITPCSGRLNIENHSAYAINYFYSQPGGMNEYPCIIYNVGIIGSLYNSDCPPMGKSEAPMQIGSNELLDEISVVPNPTTGELRIENYELGIKSIEVFDVYGRKLLSHTSQQQTINISHLQTGIYFIKIATDAEVVVKKVVKQ